MVSMYKKIKSNIPDPYFISCNNNFKVNIEINFFLLFCAPFKALSIQVLSYRVVFFII